MEGVAGRPLLPLQPRDGGVVVRAITIRLVLLVVGQFLRRGPLPRLFFGRVAAPRRLLEEIQGRLLLKRLGAPPRCRRVLIQIDARAFGASPSTFLLLTLFMPSVSDRNAASALVAVSA